MEVDPNDLFDGPGEPLPEPFKEPKRKWRNSRARRLLCDDVKNGVVQFDENNNKPVMSLEEIYSMHPEYGEYDESQFGDRLNGDHSSMLAGACVDECQAQSHPAQLCL